MFFELGFRIKSFIQIVVMYAWLFGYETIRFHKGAGNLLGQMVRLLNIFYILLLQENNKGVIWMSSLFWSLPAGQSYHQISWLVPTGKSPYFSWIWIWKKLELFRTKIGKIWNINIFEIMAPLLIHGKPYLNHM